MLQIRYVWEWPVRLTHWINAISIVVLSVTGYYIGDPFVSVQSTSQYVMGWMRFIHYSFAYLFAISLISRFIWGFIGNQHARWWPGFMPWATKEGRKNISGTFTYYTFIRKALPYVVGHNALAAMAYSGIFVLFLLQTLSGFALYAQFAPEGTMYAFFGWLNPLLGNQLLRQTHHIIMWLLIGFSIHHVYSAWLMDVKEKNGTLSSIFGGYKFIKPEDL
jgi:Ni/Fe-hydrogenase 1 B-type cytochrome subunit